MPPSASPRRHPLLPTVSPWAFFFFKKPAFPPWGRRGSALGRSSMWYPCTSRNQSLTHGGILSFSPLPGAGVGDLGWLWSLRGQAGEQSGIGQRWGWERGTLSTWRGGHGAPSLLLVDNRGSGCPETLSLAGSHISIINPTPLCTGDAAFNFLSLSPRRANERKRF